MNHHESSSDLPGLARLGRVLAPVAAVLALTAGQAVARNFIPVDEPSTVELEFDTDFLYWDLCVGAHKADAVQELADRIASAMDDPNDMYVICLPQLGQAWSNPPSGTMTGLQGESIDRRRLGFARGTYASRVERALVDVVDEVRRQRPGARFTLEDFHAEQQRNGYTENYGGLQDELSYVALSAQAPTTSTNGLNSWLTSQRIEADAMALVETERGWLLAGEGWQLRSVVDPMSDELASAWPSAGPAGGTEPGGSGGSSNPGDPVSVTDRGLSVVAGLGAGLRAPRPVDPPSSGSGGQDESGPGEPGEHGNPGEHEGPSESEHPVLIAGAGFHGVTPQPRVVGAPGMTGYNAKVMARWDVVPFQTIDAPFDIGVVAFHINGIETVEFSLNGGPWAAVTMPKENQRTGVWEYTATVDPGRLEDGLYEVRARVTPKDAGIPRILGGEITDESVGNGEHSMILSSNANQTLVTPTRYVSGFGSDSSGDGTLGNPFRSVSAALADIQSDAGRREAGGADGAFVYCLPGEYTWGPKPSTIPLTESRWATIEPAPGVRKEDVVFIDSLGGGFKTRLIHAKNVTARHPVEFTSSGREKFLWLDGVSAVGDGRVTDVQFAHGNKWTGMYVTDTYIAHTKHGAQHGALVRNSTVHDISNDAYSMGRLVVNCIADGIDPRGTDAHPDVYQLKGDGQSHENFIVYGLRAFNARSQGIFADGADRFDNIAFVNVLIERDRSLEAGGGKTCQWKDISTNHLLMRGVTLAGYTFTFRTNRIENLSVVGCVFTRLKFGETGNDIPVRLADIGGDAAFKYNHYIDVESYNTRSPGSAVTTGGNQFRDASRRDYRPRPNSMLDRFRVDFREIQTDADGQERGRMSARGALELASH